MVFMLDACESEFLLHNLNLKGCTNMSLKCASSTKYRSIIFFVFMIFLKLRLFPVKKTNWYCICFDCSRFFLLQIRDNTFYNALLTDMEMLMFGRSLPTVLTIFH